MDYSNVKLGLIDRFRVWRERQVAKNANNRNDNNKDIDYSKADKLEEELLTKRKISRATRDAKKLFRKDRKTIQNLDKEQYINQYLMDSGLKTKILPEDKSSNFMEQYPTQKTQEELDYEKATQTPDVYYKIGNELYKTSLLVKNWCFDEINNGKESPVPLETIDSKKCVMKLDDLSPEAKYNVFNKLIDIQLYSIGDNLYNTPGTKSSPDSPFSQICNKATRVDFFSKELKEQGKIEQANTMLENLTNDIFKYDKARLEAEQAKSNQNTR